MTTRRDFVKAAALAALAPALAPAAEKGACRGAADGFRTVLRKALISSVFTPAYCEKMLAADFRGVELQAKQFTRADAPEIRRLAERNGITVHSVMGGGWCAYNLPEKFESEVARTAEELRFAAACGAATLLVVPALSAPRGTEIPFAQDFAVEYDPKTLMLTRLTRGDDAKYADFIRWQNAATESARRAIERLVPVAAAEGVILAPEFVWNHLWASPAFYADFVKSFRSPWVKQYVDLGNGFKYAKSEDWLRAAGAETVKLHIKDFKVDRSTARGGEFVPIGKGDLDFPSIRRAIEEIGYSGWVSIESGGWTDAEHSAIMDRFFKGETVV